MISELIYICDIFETVLLIFGYYFISISIAYLLGDFLMGFFHWLKDTYFTPFTPIIGKRLIWDSRLHHIRPHYVTEFTNWQLFKGSASWAIIWMLPLCYLISINTFMVTLFLTIGINDVVHKYAHLSDEERPKWASFLQNIHVFQSHDEHHLHHVAPHEICYCPITPFLNTFLENIDFWRNLEANVEKVSGIKPRAKKDEYVENSNYAGGVMFLP